MLGIQAVSTGSRHVPQATAACEERSNTKVEPRKRPVRFSDHPADGRLLRLPGTTGSGVRWFQAFLLQYIFSVASRPFLAVDGRILNFRRLSQFSSVYARAVRASLY